jgi:hypothetical protein
VLSLTTLYNENINNVLTEVQFKVKRKTEVCYPISTQNTSLIKESKIWHISLSEGDI